MNALKQCKCGCFPHIYSTYEVLKFVSYVKCPGCGKETAHWSCYDKMLPTEAAIEEWNSISGANLKRYVSNDQG